VGVDDPENDFSNLPEINSMRNWFPLKRRVSRTGNIPTSGKLESLQGQIKEIQDLMAQTNNWTAIAEENSLQAEKTAMNIEKMNEETTNTLKRAMDYIQTEGATALAKAISKSDELGQQSDQMSEIAREARTFVEL